MQKSLSKILKTLVCGGEVSLAVLDTTEVVREAARRHGLSATATAALGRTLTASAYLCSWLKEAESSLSVTVKGNGAGGKLCVSGDGNLYMRGFAEQPETELPLRADGKLDVGGYVGKSGTLTVIRDDGEGIPFVGTTQLVSGEIAEDFSAYFAESEQRPTALALGVLVKGGQCMSAGGVFLQPLPGASEESMAYIENKIAEFSSVSALLSEKGAAGIMRDCFGAGDYEERGIFFRCHCSRARVESLVLSMGRREAEELVRTEGEISVHCHYCNTDYKFGAQEVAELFAAGRKHEERQ